MEQLWEWIKCCKDWAISIEEELMVPSETQTNTIYCIKTENDPDLQHALPNSFTWLYMKIIELSRENKGVIYNAFAHHKAV